MTTFSFYVLALYFCCVKGFYWKDYYGTIPNDAFQASVDEFGKPTYIGITLFEKDIDNQPTIIEEGKMPWIKMDRVFESWHMTKILCSEDNSLFHWEKVNMEKLRSLTNCRHVVIAGFQDPLTVIARAKTGNRIVTGRTHDHNGNSWFGLYLHGHKDSLKEFEVLLYGYCPHTDKYDLDLRRGT